MSQVSRRLGFGAGATWPGEIALRLSPRILTALSLQVTKGIILVAGTNGKTTTARMIQEILASTGDTVVHNHSGANLVNGVVSAMILHADWTGRIKADWGVFEVDENSLPLVLNDIRPEAIVLLNLFRDQLDRYGEVDVIAQKWQRTLNLLNSGIIILNADDPLIAHLGMRLKIPAVYFGINDEKQYLQTPEHATDSTFCLNCGARLAYRGVYFSHLGIWSCPKCGEKRPRPHHTHWKSPLPGLYNVYNALAAASVTHAVGIPNALIYRTLAQFKPVFGRQEEFKMNGRTVKLFLTKNPAGLNASLRTVLDFKPKTVLLVLNDRIPDGRDVSWIWDADFEMIPPQVKVLASGDRVYDLGVRLKYAWAEDVSTAKLTVEPNLQSALKLGIKQLAVGETLYVLATYSAMLKMRKIITGRKI